jgi:divalent metal cation (Fe/Co/Zn/Cd) transporter
LRAGRKTQPAAIQVPPALAYVLPVPAHTADKPTCFATSASIPAASFWYCFLLIAARPVLVQEAFRLEYVTLAWMLVEAVVSIGSGVAARSTTLLAAGIDSLIELASAALLIWRLTLELQRGEASAEDAERKASRVGGALLFALAAYVVIAAAWSLWTREGQEFSWPGLMVSLVSLPIMWVLLRRKLRLADALGSRALRTDAIESIACLWLSLVVVIGLLAQLGFGAWWVDAATSLAILWLLIKEGRDSWKGEEGND